MNTFDLEEGSLTADNLSEMKDYLMTAHPQEYAQLSPQLKNCSLEAELDTVRTIESLRLEKPSKVT